MSLSLNQLSRALAVSIGISSCLALFSSPAFAQTEGGMIQAPPGTTQAQVEEFNKAATLLNSGNAAEAVKVFEKVCSTIPGFAEAHQMYGTALLKVGKAKEAEVQLKKADAINPDLPMVMVNLGSVYQMQGRYSEAIAQFERYLKKYPNGQHAALIKQMMSALQTEKNRNVGTENSAGKDNYISEALALGPARWPAAKMPIKVFVNDGSNVKGFKPAYVDLLKGAFQDWAASSGGKIKIDFVDQAADAYIVCSWVDDPSEVVNPAEGGQAIVAPDEQGNLSEVKMKLLTNNPNFPSNVNEATMKHICLHEVGHALGMLGHSSQNDDVMFSTLNAGSPLAALSARDKKTISDIYSASDAFMAKHKKSDSSNNAMLGNDSNPQNRALKLNSDGINDCKAGRFAEGVSKFEEAAKLAPDNDFINVNLANGYAQLGHNAYNAKNFSAAESNLLKATDCYIKGKRGDVAKTTLSNLAVMARAQGREAEAKKYEAKASSLK